jgi:hypothetical protein
MGQNPYESPQSLMADARRKWIRWRIIPTTYAVLSAVSMPLTGTMFVAAGLALQFGLGRNRTASAPSLFIVVGLIGWVAGGVWLVSARMWWKGRWWRGLVTTAIGLVAMLTAQWIAAQVFH